MGYIVHGVTKSQAQLSMFRIVTRKLFFFSPRLKYSTQAESHDPSSCSLVKHNFTEHLLCAGDTVVNQGDMECLPSWDPQLGKGDRR